MSPSRAEEAVSLSRAGEEASLSRAGEEASLSRPKEEASLSRAEEEASPGRAEEAASRAQRAPSASSRGSRRGSEGRAVLASPRRSPAAVVERGQRPAERWRARQAQSREGPRRAALRTGSCRRPGQAVWRTGPLHRVRAQPRGHRQAGRAVRRPGAPAERLQPAMPAPVASRAWPSASRKAPLRSVAHSGCEEAAEPPARPEQPTPSVARSVLRPERPSQKAAAERVAPAVSQPEQKEVAEEAAGDALRASAVVREEEAAAAQDGPQEVAADHSAPALLASAGSPARVWPASA